MTSVPFPARTSRVARAALAEERPAEGRRDRLTGMLFVAPLAVAILLTTVYPTLFLIALATTRSTLGKPFRKFVGADQLVATLADPNFLLAMAKGIAFAFVSATAEVVVGFLIALAFATLLKLGRILLVIVLLPLMTPPVMVAIAWKLILAPAGGLLNGVLLNWGVIDAPVSFLATPLPAWLSIGVADLWQWVPFVAILSFAALMSLPDGVEEAAMVDGAGPLQRLLRITLPLVAAPLASIFLLKLIIGFKLFDLVYVLTFGGPGFATTTATFGIWRLALEQFDVGNAAAQTLVYAVVIGIVTLPVVRLHRFASENHG